MAELQKEFKTAEASSQHSSDCLRELSDICTHVAQETILYKSKYDALSNGESLLISNKGATEEIIKDVNARWVELVKQVRNMLEGQKIVYNSSNVGELTDSLNHSRILVEKNSPVSNLLGI